MVLWRRLRGPPGGIQPEEVASLALPLLLISQHLYKRHFCRLLTFLSRSFLKALLAFAGQVSGAVQKAVDLVAVLADEQFALFFSG